MRLFVLFLMSCVSLQGIASINSDQKTGLSQQLFISSTQLNLEGLTVHKRVLEALKNKTVVSAQDVLLVGDIANDFTQLYFKLNKEVRAGNQKAFNQIRINYLTLYQPFISNKKFRRLLRKTHSDNGKQYRYVLTALKNIEQSLYQQSQLANFNVTLQDQHLDFFDRLTHSTSKLFGNAVGKVRWRRGFLESNKHHQKRILEQLQPLDILTEKTYFALTDKLIPGYFGHAAIWLGDAQSLKNLGVWNHANIKPYQQQILAGKQILETDRTGTHLKTLEEFMNIDELAVLRVSDFTRQQKISTYINSFAQIGKSYDFNFDVQTIDKLVCSELVYLSYDFINWPTEQLLGRPTISPDNLAATIMQKKSPIEMVLYLGGKKKKSVKFKSEQQLIKDLRRG